MSNHNIKEADTSAVNIDEFLFVTVKQGIEDLVFITDDGGNSFAIPKDVLEAFIAQELSSAGKMTFDTSSAISRDLRTLIDNRKGEYELLQTLPVNHHLIRELLNLDDIRIALGEDLEEDLGGWVAEAVKLNSKIAFTNYRDFLFKVTDGKVGFSYGIS
jgi:hypothetical protein